MLKHIVVMKFRSGVTEAQVGDLEKSLKTLSGIIPEIKGYEFGRDPRAEKVFDFCLVSTFDDFDALQRYRVHPDHVAVLQKVKALCETIQAVDFIW